MGVSLMVVMKGGVKSGGEVRFWKGRSLYLRGGGHILGGPGRFWEGGIDCF